MTETFRSKLGTSRAGDYSRIWLEGRRLLDAGFNYQDKFRKTFGVGFLILERCTEKEFDELPRAKRGTVSGSKDRPVIDILGEVVMDTFAQEISVSFRKGKIVCRAYLGD